MKQLSKEEAIALFESGVWKEWSDEQVVMFGLFQDSFFVDFDRLHEAITNVFGRPVYTHEFLFRDELIKEYLGEKPAPTFEEIVALIPEEKRIIIGV